MNIETIIASLTLAEKAALLQGKSNWQTRDIPRLGIPSMFLSDGPSGLRKQEGKNADHLGLNESRPATCFPAAVTMAATWDPELEEKLGAALGAEAADQGVHMVLGPGLNLKRDPRCGRNFEYFSEDPYLSGKMAAAMVRGIQSRGAGACVKHFAANSQELRRMASDSLVDERTLRELYLTGFEIAVREARPLGIMSAYNRVNGVYANEDPWLLRKVLREEWGFSGFVVTDWGASNSHPEGVRNGSGLEMPGPGADSALGLIAAVEKGELSEQALDDRLRELLPVVFRLTETKQAPADYPAHHALARRCAAAGTVLLENDGILPLKQGVSLGLIGDFARHPRYQGAGSSQVNPTRVVSLEEALEGRIAGFAPGYRGVTTEEALLAEAVTLSKNVEIVVLCLGLDPSFESEGLDRQHISMPESHLALLEAVRAVNPNIVLCLSGGAPFLLPETGFRAALYGGLGGQAGAEAMAQVLFGQAEPGGHLTETWPKQLSDVPAYGNYPAEGPQARYEEGLFVGYRHYESRGIPVRYPFGHGLSYTEFSWSDLTVTEKEVSFTLKNIGSRPGSQVAQVYISLPESGILRPVLELKGFRKVFLQAGEEKTVIIPLESYAFRVYSTELGRWAVEQGRYTVAVGSSCRELHLTAELTLSGEVLSEQPVFLPEGAKQEQGITILSTVGELTEAKSAFARTLGRWARSAAGKAAEGKADMTALFICNMPLRALAQMTGGQITRQMAQDFVYLCNGHFFRGMGRLVAHYFRGRREARAFRKALNLERR